MHGRKSVDWQNIQEKNLGESILENCLISFTIKESSNIFFFCIMIKKGKMMGGDLVLLTGCWLDGGTLADPEFAVNYKKGVGFKQIKWLENNCMRHLLFHWKIQSWYFKNYEIKKINIYTDELFTTRSVTHIWKINKDHVKKKIVFAAWKA